MSRSWPPVLAAARAAGTVMPGDFPVAGSSVGESFAFRLRPFAAFFVKACILCCLLWPLAGHAAEVVRDDDWKVDVGGVLAGTGAGLHLFWPWAVIAGPPALGAPGWDSRDALYGAGDARLQFSGRYREDVFSWDVQARAGFWLFSQPNMAFALAGSGTSAAAEPPRSLPLQYTDALEQRIMSASVDRFWVRTRLGPADILLGRQAVGFGASYIWQPMDLLGTFSPLAIDREFKPGVDALRVNLTFGEATELALVAAPGAPACLHVQRPSPADPLAASVWQTAFGKPCSPGEVRYEAEASSALARFRTTLGEFDLGFLAGMVRGDLVGGAFASGTLGRWKLTGEATFTHDRDAGESGNDDVSFRRNFARAVAGIDYNFDFNRPLHVYGAFHFNGYGTTKPEEYMAVAASARVATYAEIANLGRYYLGAGALWELTEKMKLSALGMANLTDPSALFSLSLEILLTNESVLYVGGFVPVGKRPEIVTVNGIPTGFDPGSEFGMMPAAVHLLYKRYF